MKKIWAVLIAACLALTVFTACGEDEPANNETAAGGIEGNWINEDQTVTININDAGQVWYSNNGELLFRGYLEAVELPVIEGENAYLVRYDFFNSADVLLSSFYHNELEKVLLEENIEGKIVDNYRYIGEFIAP